jgi:osmotically-inducible protein OsmY
VLRRLLALIAVVVLVMIALQYWRTRHSPAQADGTARELGRDARELGAEAREKLGQARDKLGEVGEDLRDAKVSASVKTAFSLNRSLKPYSIDVDTDDRVVTLRGRVDGEDVRARFESVAAEVPDVVRVVNQIEVGPLDRREGGGSPAERAQAAQRAVDANSNLQGLGLQVRVEGERLVLHGQARTPAEKDLAGLLAREGAGGPVENAVEVRPGTP